MATTTVAIIGCGMAGTSLARLISDNLENVSTTLFDKGRGIGGRMATRYDPHHQFDHGAQFFTVRSNEFADFLTPYKSSYASWDARATTLSPGGKSYGRMWFEPHYVSSPRMNSLNKDIAAGIETHLGHQITKISGNPGQWFLESEQALSGPFDWVISTAPAPQTAALLRTELNGAQYDPTFALMAALTSPPKFDAAVVKDSPIAWLALSTSKPGRSAMLHPCLVAHASADWSTCYLEQPVDVVKFELLSALKLLPDVCIDPASAQLHRWRYARVTGTTEDPFYLDQRKQLAACGDWGVGPGVEEAFLSAHHLFRSIRHLL